MVQAAEVITTTKEAEEAKEKKPNPLLATYELSSSLATAYNLTEGYIKRLCRSSGLDYIPYPRGNGKSDYLVIEAEFQKALLDHKRANRDRRTLKAKAAAAARKKAKKMGFSSVAEMRAAEAKK